MLYVSSGSYFLELVSVNDKSLCMCICLFSCSAQYIVILETVYDNILYHYLFQNFNMTEFNIKEISEKEALVNLHHQTR